MAELGHLGLRRLIMLINIAIYCNEVHVLKTQHCPLFFTHSHQIHMRGLLGQDADLDDSEAPLDGVRDEQVLLRPYLLVLMQGR